MSVSLLSADRATHLKIIVVSLIAATVVVLIGINARISDSTNMTARIETNGPVIKAGKPAIYSTRGISDVGSSADGAITFVK